jgi:hypothetical protein
MIFFLNISKKQKESGRGISDIIELTWIASLMFSKSKKKNPEYPPLKSMDSIAYYV